MLKYLAFGLALIFSGSYQACLAAANNNLAPVPIRVGDSPLEIMKKNGFSAAQCSEILRDAPGLENVFLTTDLFYFREKSSKRVELRIHDQATDRAFKIWREGKSAGAEVYKPHLAIVVAQAEGRIHGSLMETLHHAVNSNWVASRFLDAFSMEHKLNAMPAGAHYSLKYEKKFEDGHFVKYGEVTHAALDIDDEHIVKNFVKVADGGVFITAKDLESKKPLYAPVNYIRIASEFQPNRRHPITHRIQPHLGIDFEVPAGSPVFAAKKGVVARLGHSRAAGNFIVLTHAPGIETAYDHLRKLAPGVHVGQVIDVGQRIAEVGCTGYCTKPHLHFALKLHGKMVNPAKYLKPYPWEFEHSLQSKVAVYE